MKRLYKTRDYWKLMGAGTAAYCTYMGIFRTENTAPAFQTGLIYCGLFGLYLLFAKRGYLKNKVKLLLPVSLLVGAICSAGKVLFSGMEFRGYSVKTLLVIDTLGYGAVVYCLGKLLYGLMEDSVRSRKKQTGLRLFAVKSRLNVFVLLLILWLPHLILKYPSGINIDSLDAVEFYLGIQSVNYNPTVYVVVLGSFFKLGMLLGHPNLGFFLFNLAIYFLLAYAVAEGYRFLADIMAANWAKTVYLLFFSFSPFVTGYIGNCIKDMPYISFMLLFLVQTGYWLFSPEQFWGNKKRMALAAVSSCGMAVFRNNGLYILLLMFLLVLIMELRRKGSKMRGKAAYLLVLAALPVLTNTAAKGIAGDGGAAGARENLSLPFQQTARLILEHPELINEEEKAVIDKVFDFALAAEKYDPLISDPVKNLYREECTPEDRAEYLKLWAKQFFRAPGTYLKAVIAQNYFLFYPESSNYYYYYACPHYDFRLTDQSVAHIGSPEYLSDKLGWYYREVFRGLHELPVLFTLNNMSSYNVLLLLLTCFAITKKDKTLILMLPALITLFGIPLGPCILGHPRYAFPIIYFLPLFLGAYARGREQ